MTLVDLMPDWYANVVEMRKLLQAEDHLINLTETNLQIVQNSQYISTANGDVISMYEELLKISTTPGDSLELRRFRILNKLSIRKPYTKRYLQELISSLDDQISFEILYEKYQIDIDIDARKVVELDEIKYLVELIRTIVPANMDVQSKMTQIITILSRRTYWRFEKVLVGDYITGEYVDTATQGRVAHDEATVVASKQAHVYPYDIAGEYPETSTITDINPSGFGAEANHSTHKVAYKLSGDDDF